MKPKLILVMGFPGSGKTTYTKQLTDQGYIQMSRDDFDLPGKICSSAHFHDFHLRATMKAGENIVVDNTYPTIEKRKLAIDLAKQYGYEIHCWHLKTTIEETQYNVCTRMMKRYGKLVDKNESEATKNDSNIFPPAVLFAYKKTFEKPTEAEGFDKVISKPFVREYDPTYTNKAVIFDYDGTLRETKSGAIYPTDPHDIKILPGRVEKLQELENAGYLLLGVSNQSGIAKGHLDHNKAKKCFEMTNHLVFQDIDYLYCPHNVPPITCYCRKPMPGHGVVLIEKYKLDPRKCIMVGDMTSDETFAKRCGFKYVDQSKFF